MPSARFLFVALVALWCLAGIAPAAANPNVTSIDPKSLFACAGPYSSRAGVTLYGSGLVASDTTGYTINSDVQIMVRHNGGSFAPTQLSGWNSGQLSAQLRCADFSQTVPGWLEFQVILRGVAGNVFSVPLMAIPSGPPSLTSVSPSQRDVGLTGTFDYLVRVRGTNMPDDTKATIDGEGAGIGRAWFSDGFMDIWVPIGLRSKPGVYAVQLHDSKGASNTVNLTIGKTYNLSLGNIGGLATLPTPTPTPNPFVARLGVGVQAVLESLDVQITNFAGHVTLKGRASSIEAKARLIAAVRAMPDVVSVTDLITVDPAPHGPPTMLPH